MTTTRRKIRTQRARYRAHKFFDAIWLGTKNKKGSREAAYNWLSRKLRIQKEDCHFSKLSEEKCDEIVDMLHRAAFLHDDPMGLGVLLMVSECKAPKGKFRVLGIDKYETPGEGHWVDGDYDKLEVALSSARDKTRKAATSASHASIATVYYVYDDKGVFLGPNEKFEYGKR